VQLKIGEGKGTAENKNKIDLYGFAMLDSGYDFKTNDPTGSNVVPQQSCRLQNRVCTRRKGLLRGRPDSIRREDVHPLSLGDLKQFEFELLAPGRRGQTTFACDTLTVNWDSSVRSNLEPVHGIDVFPNPSITGAQRDGVSSELAVSLDADQKCRPTHVCWERREPCRRGVYAIE